MSSDPHNEVIVQPGQGGGDLEFADLGEFTSGVAGVTSDMLGAANALKGTTTYLIQGLQAFSEHYKDVPQQQQALLLAMNNAIQLLQLEREMQHKIVVRMISATEN